MAACIHCLYRTTKFNFLFFFFFGVLPKSALQFKFFFVLCFVGVLVSRMIVSDVYFLHNFCCTILYHCMAKKVYINWSSNRVFSGLMCVNLMVLDLGSGV